MPSTLTAPVLAGISCRKAVNPGDCFPTIYHGFDQLQVEIISVSASPVALNQSSGNLGCASSGDSPKQSVGNSIPGIRRLAFTTRAGVPCLIAHSGPSIAPEINC